MDTYDDKNPAVAELELKSLGSRIRRTRHRRGETIDQVAGRSGLSASLISQVERGIVSPSVSTLWRIAQALDRPMGFFFGEDQGDQRVVRKDERKTISAPRNGLFYELLSPDLNRETEFLMITLKPGSCDFEHFFEHEGEECVIVIATCRTTSAIRARSIQ